MSITIIGSVALDSIITPFGARDNILGGSATYASISASFFQSKINLVAVVGKDFPKKYISLFKERGIGLKGFEVKAGSTFRWKGKYAYDMNERKTIYTHLNVFRDFNPRLAGSFRNAKFLFLANIDPVLQSSVLSQARTSSIVACDTMDWWIKTRKKDLIKLIKKVDILLLNDGEARQLSEEANLLKAARFVLDRGAGAVVIKKGEHGVLFFSKAFHFLCPAYLLETINDPTGAGDVFAGGMLGFLSGCKKLNEGALRKSLVYGSVLASFAVEDFGVGGLIRTTKRDVEKRYKSFQRITRF